MAKTFKEYSLQVFFPLLSGFTVCGYLLFRYEPVVLQLIVIWDILLLIGWALWYYTIERKIICFKDKITGQPTKILLYKSMTEHQIIQLLSDKLLGETNGKIIGVVCELDGVLVPPDMIFALCFDYFMRGAVYEIVTDVEMMNLEKVKANGVVNLEEDDNNGGFDSDKVCKFNIDDFVRPRGGRISASTITRFNAELRMRGFVIISLTPSFADPIKQLFSISKDFFHTPLHSKMRHSIKYAKGGKRGYMRELGREYFEMRAIGEQLRDIQWPSDSYKQGYEDGFNTFFNLGKIFLGVIADGLGLPHSTLLDLLDDTRELPQKYASASMLRVHRYSNGLKLPMQARITDYVLPHADIGLISISPRASTKGLEVKELLHPEKGWLTAEDLMDSNDVVVFTGQMLTRITNGLYRPVIHRPITPKETERLSMVFFLRAAFNKRVRSLVTKTLPGMDSVWTTSELDGTAVENEIQQHRTIGRTPASAIRWLLYQMKRKPRLNRPSFV